WPNDSHFFSRSLLDVQLAMERDGVIGRIQRIFSGREFYQQVRTFSDGIQNGVAQFILDRYLDVADIFGRGTGRLCQLKRQWPCASCLQYRSRLIFADAS